MMEPSMTVAQAPPVPLRRPPPAVARAWVISDSKDDNLPDHFHDPEEDLYVPPSPNIGMEFWPTHVHFTLDRDHVAWGDRAAKIEILRAIEYLALRRPFHLAPIVPSRPDYMGLITTARAGRSMSPRTWEVFLEGPRTYRVNCISLGPWLTVRQRQDRLEDPDHWIDIDTIQTNLWMATFGLHIYTPDPAQWLPDPDDERVPRLN